MMMDSGNEYKKSDDNLEDFVLSALKSHRDIQGILISQICEKTGWDWAQSEQYIEKVKSLHGFELSNSKYKTYLIIGTATGIGGLGLMLFAFDIYIGLGAFSHCFSLGLKEPWPKITGFPALEQCIGIDPSYLSDFYLLFLLGGLMLVGSMVGIYFAYQELRA
jgi:hypothetical protein